MKELTPKEIVKELDKYIVGQEEAKKYVAIAIRNRWRRQQLPPELRDEIAPKNIIMIGPTGVGKTEIARRLANLIKAPFIKVEATKYTEVGYHGRDVETIIRDLVEASVALVKKEHAKIVKEKAERYAEEKLVDFIYKSFHKTYKEMHPEKRINKRNIKNNLRKGRLDKEIIEITVPEKANSIEIFSNAPPDFFEIQTMLEKVFPGKPKTKKVTVEEAKKILLEQESEKLIDKENVIKEALERAENMGIVFIDELDKVAGSNYKHGPDVSREGVQRDLLPIVEGTTVITRYGPVKTDHILFIAAGAFNVSKPSDLIPELQGRFPIRVELKSLTKKEFIRILKEPKNALTKQYKELLKTEGINLNFEEDSIEEIAKICEEVNEKMQNIGARRLHTIMEKLLEDISFEGPDLKEKNITITADMVKNKLKNIVKDEDLSKYIL